MPSVLVVCPVQGCRASKRFLKSLVVTVHSHWWRTICRSFELVWTISLETGGWRARLWVLTWVAQGVAVLVDFVSAGCTA